MAELQLEIEGEGAVAAAKALVEIPGVSGYWAPAGEPRREVTMAVTMETVATIVGIASGSLVIAQSLHYWYKQFSQDESGHQIDKVVLIGRNGEKLLLANATVEQIKKILET